MTNQTQPNDTKNHLKKARIIGLGSYLPKKVLTNHDLENLVETSDEWILSRTGIRERRIAEENEFTSDMGAIAATEALKEAKINAEDIELIIVATMSPDYISPSTAGLIQAKLKADKAAAFDIQAACSGFLYALSTAKAFVESGLYRNVLLVAAEKMSAFMDYTDRSTCILFGDGAAAAVIAANGPGLRIDSLCLGSDGQLADLIKIPGGGARFPATLETVEKKLHYFQMSGNEVFKHAIRRMTHAARECLEKAGLVEEEVRWFVPHQANKRIIDLIAKNFNIPEERVYLTLHKYGNTSASSIGIALYELMQGERCQDGEHLLLTVFGGGLTWGAALLTIDKDKEGLQ